MPIVKMNCEMIAGVRRHEAGPSHITKSESFQLEVRPRVHIITKYHTI